MPDSPVLQVSSRRSGRVLSLDVLRGIAILLMILSGLLPKTLPNWMDHGYNPHYLPDASGAWTLRPEIAAGNPGSLFVKHYMAFTWVDLVFPMFLFAMGASIPIALRRRQADGYSGGNMLSFIGARWVVLVIFAVVVNLLTTRHLTSINPDTSRFLTIGSLLIAFLFFVRWPDSVPPGVVWAIRATALVMIIIRITAFTIRNEDTFNWSEADIIILVLAHTYAIASLLWLITSNLHGFRIVLAFPLMLLAHEAQFGQDRMSNMPQFVQQSSDALHTGLGWFQNVLNFGSWMPGLSALATENTWIKDLFNLSPLWHFSWLKYLWVVIPGTIAGDWLYGWSQRQTIGEPDDTPGPALPGAAYALIMLILVSLFVGLRHYGYPTFGLGGPLKTPLLAMVFAGLGLAALVFVAWPRAYGHLWVARKLLFWGAVLTGLGLALATVPFDGGYFENGISKGPPATLSYYLLSSGLCMLILLALVPILDVRHWRDPLTSIVAANGQNAMLAYFVSHATAPAVFTLSVFAAFGLPFGEEVRSLQDMAQRLLPGTAGATVWAILRTLLIALFVYLCTRLRMYWRA